MGAFSNLKNILTQGQNSSPENFAKRNLARAVERTGRDRVRDLEPVGSLAAASAGTADARARRRLGAAASSVAAQSETGRPTSFGDAIASAGRRAKVRQGIVARGEPAIQNQALRDRLEIARRGKRRQGQVLQGLASGANIREGVNLGVADAESLISASRADLTGGLLGGVTGVLSDPASRSRLGGIASRIGGIFGGNTLSDAQMATATSNLFHG